MKVKRGPKSIKYLWFLGFLGFQGFTYFKTGNSLSLFWFSFFSFFAYYFIAKMANEMPDERYFENGQKAKLKTANIPLVILFIIGFSGVSFYYKRTNYFDLCFWMGGYDNIVCFSFLVL